MRIRKTEIICFVLIFVVILGAGIFAPTTAASKKSVSAAAFLGQSYLQGSMQGSSGAVLDFNGDGREDLVIGAPYARHKGTNGAVLVYRATDKGFIKAPAFILKGDGNLGWSLVSLGDVNRDGKDWFAAGAHSGSSENVSLSGTVTIYRGGDVPQKFLCLEGDNAMDKFGYVVASGDLNDDGDNDLIVGAPLNSPDPARYQQGAVYVFFGPAFDQKKRLKIPTTQNFRAIGFSIATGDINGDGADDLLMEASGNVIGFYGGKSFSLLDDPEVYPEVVFSCKDRGFGRAISVIGDLDDDGYNEVALGAYQAAIDDLDTGRLFIIKGGAGIRTVDLDKNPSDLLARIDGEPNCGQFAKAILPIKDLDGDGITDLAVSAVHADGDSWPMTGKVFIFSGRDLSDGVTVDSARVFSGMAKDMHLGAFLALITDKMWLVAGAPTEKANTGRVHLFDLYTLSHQGAAKKR